MSDVIPTTPMRRSMLCVGGPRAGRRYAVLHGSGFRVAVTQQSSIEFNGDKHTEEKVEVAIVDYRAEQLHTPEGDVSFWVPSQQTALETIQLLLETYEKAHLKNR